MQVIDIVPRGDVIFSHTSFLFVASCSFFIYGNLVFVRSVDFTSRLGVGENIQSQDLCISSFLDHLLRKPSKWLDGQDLFSVVDCT